MKIEDHLYKYISLYLNSPDIIKIISGNLFRLIPLKYRYGNKLAFFKNLVESEKTLTNDQILEFQLNSLQTLVSYAYDNVPFYKKLYDGYDLRIKSFEDFHKLPFLTKQDVRDNTKNLVSTKYNENEFIIQSTGGSSGEPLKIYTEKGTFRTKEFVYLNDMWSRIGYKHGDKIAQLRSFYIKDRIKGKLWEYEPIKNRWVFSTYDLTPDNMPLVLSKIRKIQPKYLYVYPSALTILAEYMLANQESPISSVKGILSGSENTFPSQISLFKRVFQCHILRWYGLGEGSALAGSTANSFDYHCYPTYSYAEIVDEKGNHINELGTAGEIVGTTFHQFCMPFIRYRTGDNATYGGITWDGSNRKTLRFKEIEGRKQEIIIDNNGNTHTLGPYIFGIHEDFWSNISQIQFQQDKIGTLKIKVLSNRLEPDVATKYVKKLFENRFKNHFDIEVYFMNKPFKTKLGKHKYLIQNLNIANRVSEEL